MVTASALASVAALVRAFLDPRGAAAVKVALDADAKIIIRINDHDLHIVPAIPHKLLGHAARFCPAKAARSMIKIAICNHRIPYVLALILHFFILLLIARRGRAPGGVRVAYPSNTYIIAY